jgi:hypothetical protein
MFGSQSCTAYSQHTCRPSTLTHLSVNHLLNEPYIVVKMSP